MMKIRLTNSFKEAINEARRVFGVEGNDRTTICKRALRCWNNEKFLYSACNDKTIGSPVTINVDTDLKPKEFQGLVIAYIQRCIARHYSYRQRPLQLDSCDNYVIEND